MKVGAFFFAPHIIPTSVILIFVPLFTWLGFWQLERAEYKRQLFEQMEQQQQQPPVDLNKPAGSDAGMEYRPVMVRGYFEPDQQIFIENRKHQSKNGFYVVTPLRIEGGNTRVLVNRGWVPINNKRSKLPVVKTPPERVEITGNIDLPKPPAIKLPLENERVKGSNRWHYLSVDRFAAGVDYPMKDFVILQSPTDDHGFVRKWPVKAQNDLMHIGYALQWFAFALIATLIYLRLSISRKATVSKEAF